MRPNTGLEGIHVRVICHSINYANILRRVVLSAHTLSIFVCTCRGYLLGGDGLVQVGASIL